MFISSQGVSLILGMKIGFLRVGSNTGMWKVLMSGIGLDFNKDCELNGFAEGILIIEGLRHLWGITIFRSSLAGAVVLPGIWIRKELQVFHFFEWVQFDLFVESSVWFSEFIVSIHLKLAWINSSTLCIFFWSLLTTLGFDLFHQKNRLSLFKLVFVLVLCTYWLFSRSITLRKLESSLGTTFQDFSKLK